LIDYPVLSQDDFECGFYLRVTAIDQPGVMADISGVFARHGISIEAILQKEPANPSSDGAAVERPIVLLSHLVSEGTMRKAIEEVQSLASVNSPITLLRVENF